MNGPSLPRCAFARLVPLPSTSEGDLFLMRRRAWREQRIAILPLDHITDDWLRQAVTNEATRLYGDTNGKTR